jgi:hypothetical protein
MGLDAVVFCDCVEKGCLLVPHPYPRLLYIASNGAPEIRSKDPAKADEHDRWMDLPPCKHEGMMLAGCSVGNMMFVPHLRDILSAVATKRGHACPVLLGKVLYSGTHCGDHLTVRDVGRLSNELESLKGAKLSAAALSGEDAQQIATAMRDLRRLVKTALAVIKPIAL